MLHTTCHVSGILVLKDEFFSMLRNENMHRSFNHEAAPRVLRTTCVPQNTSLAGEQKMKATWDAQEYKFGDVTKAAVNKAMEKVADFTGKA